MEAVLWLSILLQAGVLFALNPRKSMELLRHNVWTADDGLPMNSVSCITQTPEGYIWLGTETGLARFDGIDFDVFNKENTPALLNDFILSMEMDNNGVLWIGTRGGGIVRFQNGTFDVLTKKNSLLSDEVWAILKTRDGAMWIGTRNGLNRFWEGKLSPIQLEEKVDGHNVRALVEDQLGRVWVGTRGSGLFMVEKRENRYESINKGLAGLKICALLEDRIGNIWIGTEESGLGRYQGNQSSFYSTKNGLSTNYVRCLLEDREGDLWIGTYGGGLHVLKNGESRLLSFNSQNGLSSNAIGALYEDNEGTLWIGTDGGGLNALRDTRITTYTKKNGLSNENVYAIFEDSQETLWVSTMGSGVNYSNVKDVRFESITKRDGLSDNFVVSISEYPNGCLWFGTLGGGVNRVVMKNRQFDVFTTQEGLSDNFVRALYLDSSGNLWAGTDSGGLHRFSNGRFVLSANLGFRVNTIFKDSRGNLWIGTWGNGLCLFKDGKIQVFREEEGLSDDNVLAIHEDQEGNLWIGTYGGGLNCFRQGKFTVIGKKQGLPDNTIYCILEDHNNYLWMSSNHGIFYVKRSDLDDFVKGKIKRLSPSLFTIDDGMKSIECNGANQPSGWKTRDGRLWFSTTKGVSVVDPENIGINTLPPPVQIKSVIINGISNDVGKKAVVPPGKGNIDIYYTGLSFVAPKRTFFKYKLENLDDQWVYAGTRRVVSYKGLPPGSYRFRVIACNSDGVWNNTGAFFDFDIEPKYYQTLIFKISFPLGVVLVAVLLYFSVKKYLFFLKMKRKYVGSSLDPQEAKEYLKKMLYLVEVKKIYKDADVSLNSLAKQLSTSPRNLSQIINEHLGLHFHAFINKYRVEEAKKILLSPEANQTSILEIGYEVGFNSKSAFNRAFKDFIEMTPSQFKKTVVKNMKL
ncbi:MAG: helix-turn-helix domain-containing protein [Candidatus Aminicenantes bacterium]|nr:helix-turn-helix domain-containing protein [Candidatus Aminicenantes bacterium]